MSHDRIDRSNNDWSQRQSAPKHRLECRLQFSGSLPESSLQLLIPGVLTGRAVLPFLGSPLLSTITAVLTTNLLGLPISKADSNLKVLLRPVRDDLV